MSTRPRDLCTAAFNDDTERLRQLIVAAGVYTGRWQPPCRIDTSPAARAIVDADVVDDDAADDVGSGMAKNHRSTVPSYETDNIISEDAEEELAELISEEEMAALMVHPELQRVTHAYSLDLANADDANSEDQHEETEDGNDGELLDESEEEAAEADRQAQQRDLLIYRCLLAVQHHRDSIAQRLQQQGLVQTSTTPPVNMTSYGILFSCRERAVLLPRSEEVGDAHNHSGDPCSAHPAAISLQVRWQPSKRSRYGGTPLHWAVLARAHAMVKFLIEHGADETLGLKSVDLTAGAAAMENGHGDMAATTTASVAAEKVLGKLTPAFMAEANESLPTLQALDTALAARAVDQANREAFFTALENRMRRRKERYAQRRHNAVLRRAQQAQAQREEEEREREENERLAAEQEEDEGEQDEEDADYNYTG